MKKIGFYLTIAVFVIFAVLKLTGVIAWSWRWITAPIWIPFIIAVILVIAFFWLLGKYDSNNNDFTGV
jgi:predicted PurR-regulated permease PerM